MHPVTLEVVARDGAARAGVAHAARGTYRTPCFMPVGTRGAVKYLSAADYERLGVEIVLANTYHLMLRPGAEVVARFGGLGRFAGWTNPERNAWNTVRLYAEFAGTLTPQQDLAAQNAAVAEYQAIRRSRRGA